MKQNDIFIACTAILILAIGFALGVAFTDHAPPPKPQANSYLANFSDDSAACWQQEDVTICVPLPRAPVHYSQCWDSSGRDVLCFAEPSPDAIQENHR